MHGHTDTLELLLTLLHHRQKLSTSLDCRVCPPAKVCPGTYVCYLLLCSKVACKLARRGPLRRRIWYLRGFDLVQAYLFVETRGTSRAKETVRLCTV